MNLSIKKTYTTVVVVVIIAVVLILSGTYFYGRRREGFVTVLTSQSALTGSLSLEAIQGGIGFALGFLQRLPILLSYRFAAKQDETEKDDPYSNLKLQNGNDAFNPPKNWKDVLNPFLAMAKIKAIDFST